MTDWSSTALTPDHELQSFDSGQPSLDHWLREQALRAQQQGTARTWVWTAATSMEVVAYFSVAPTQVARDVLTSSQCGGATVVPGYLVARLALTKALQGDQLGGELLYDALSCIVAASGQAGGRLVVVDAIDERAERFYARFDFKPTKVVKSADDPEPDPKLPAYPRRMVVKIETVRAAFGL